MASTRESSDTPGKGGVKSFVVAALGVILVGAGGGYGAALMLIPPAEVKLHPTTSAEPAAATGEAETPERDAAADVEPAVATETVVLALQPIVTNLKEPTDVWVRLEGSLVIRKAADASPPPDLAFRMSRHYLAYLRTLTIADFEGTQGLYAINQDMNEIAASLSGGLATEFLLSSLVLE